MRLTLKIFDGIVIGADSAATFIVPGADGTPIVTVYNNANKITNLHKGLPIGMVSWGAGGFGEASIAILLKDLRQRFTGEVIGGTENWLIDSAAYHIEWVATRVRDFLIKEHYEPAAQLLPLGQKPAFGFLVAGYSSDSATPEVWRFDIDSSGNQTLQNVGSNPVAISVGGQPQAISRLLLGFDPALPDVLKDHLGIPDAELPGVVAILGQQLGVPVLSPGMPIQDGIDLVDFLVDLTCRYVRFSFGPSTVGGPPEIAAITKHEGFKWIKRKHFYPQPLNPGGLT